MKDTKQENILLALVSMDNCSQYGAKLRESVLTMAEEWKKAGFVDEKTSLPYVSDEDVVAFPWTMIDKITPRPSEQIAADRGKYLAWRICSR